MHKCTYSLYVDMRCARAMAVLEDPLSAPTPFFLASLRQCCYSLSDSKLPCWCQIRRLTLIESSNKPSKVSNV